jgi:hypothetical protein
MAWLFEQQETDSHQKTRTVWALASSVVLFLAAGRVASAQQSNAIPGSWSGVLESSSCNADEAFNEVPDCSKNVPGGKISLYDDTDRVMYGLEPQQEVTESLGESVTVHGTLDHGTIHFTSIQPMTIGLNIGQKAPPFSARDQFGRVETLDTLRGRNGTVLLFFRSADW